MKDGDKRYFTLPTPFYRELRRYQRKHHPEFRAHSWIELCLRKGFAAAKHEDKHPTDCEG